MSNSESPSNDPIDILQQAISNKPAEFGRRKSDIASYSIDDFDKAVQVLKKIDEKSSTDIPSAETIEAVAELEDQRLKTWVVKLLGFSLVFVIFVIFSAVVYSTITGNDIAVPNFVSGTFTTIKDIVTAIIETKG